MTNPNERIELDAAGLEAGKTDRDSVIALWDAERPIGGMFFHELPQGQQNFAVLCFKAGKHLSATPQPQGLGEPALSRSRSETPASRTT